MGERGPLGKDTRVRGRDNKTRETLVKDDVLRGFPLPPDALPVIRVFVADDDSDIGGVWEDQREQWHPRVVAWWEAFRRSPMAARVTEDVQWETLAGHMLAYQDVWTGGQKGRAGRLAEFRGIWASYFITPGDLRRNGLEIEVPKTGGEDAKTTASGPPAPTSIASRRGRILEAVPDPPAARKAPAKKRVRSAREKAAIARKTAAPKKAPAKKTAAKRPSKSTG